MSPSTFLCSSIKITWICLATAFFGSVAAPPQPKAGAYTDINTQAAAVSIAFSIQCGLSRPLALPKRPRAPAWPSKTYNMFRTPHDTNAGWRAKAESSNLRRGSHGNGHKLLAPRIRAYPMRNNIPISVLQYKECGTSGGTIQRISSSLPKYLLQMFQSDVAVRAGEALTPAALPSTLSVQGRASATNDLWPRGCGQSWKLMHGIAARAATRK